jgi:Uma2 family endonuclease
MPALKMRIDDFVAWEASQEARHEFYRGEVFAMVGVRRVHAIVSGNVFLALQSRLKGRRCRAFTESVKVQVANDAIFYPDVFVTCNEADLHTDIIFRHPMLVVEVMSASTQAYDRGLKFMAYRALAALQEYVLVDPQTRHVEVFRRNERGNFELLDQSKHTHLVLDSVGLEVPMAELFDGLGATDTDTAEPA